MYRKKEAVKRTSVTGADELEMRKEIGLSNGINDILYFEVKAKQDLLNKCLKFILHYHNYIFKNLQVIIIMFEIQWNLFYERNKLEMIVHEECIGKDFIIEMHFKRFFLYRNVLVMTLQYWRLF